MAKGKIVSSKFQVSIFAIIYSSTVMLFAVVSFKKNYLHNIEIYFTAP